MTTAFSYIRFSTPEQLKGDSLRRQTELSEHYAKAHNLTLDTTLNLRDLGISAFDRSNITKGALGQFLRLVEEGMIPRGSYLLIESLDRLSRAQVTDALTVFLNILKAGITIVTLADNQLYNSEAVNENWANLIVSIAIMSRATEESATKSKRIRASWDNKRNKIGEKILTARCPAWLKVKADRSGFEVIPERAKVLKWIYEQAVSGIGSYTITRQLNEQKIPTFSKTALWGSSVVEKLLHSAAVHGELHPQHQRDGVIVKVGEAIPDYYPSVIPKETFTLVQTQRTDRRKGSGNRKGVGLSNLFSGMLRCGYCGGTMVMGGAVKPLPDGTKLATKYVVCHTSKKGAGCHYMQWQYADLEELTLRFCKEVDFAELLNPARAVEKGLEAQRKRVVTLEVGITDKEGKLAKLLTAIESGDVPATIIKRMAELELQLVDAKEVLVEERRLLEQKQSEVTSSADLQRTVVELFERMRGLEGDDLYNLRVRLSERLHRVFEKIKLFPGGDFGKAYKAGTLGKLMGLGGHKDPDKAKRYMKVAFKSGEFRIVKADQSVMSSRRVTPEGTRAKGKYTT